MIPKIQNKFYPNGNCFPAAIASILEMEVNDVIHIQDGILSIDWLMKIIKLKK